MDEVCDIVQETGGKTILKKKKCKKAKWLSEEALQIAVKRREAKNKGQKERYTHLNAEFQRLPHIKMGAKEKRNSEDTDLWLALYFFKTKININ